ncbi:MAG: hypothetical protein L0Y64_22575 [Myxococcaceae bacterium]|nr:hypothetical protein [Myxococcaceae bacterium]
MSYQQQINALEARVTALERRLEGLAELEPRVEAAEASLRARGPRGARDEAVERLRAALAGGPRLGRDCVTELVAAGFAERTAYRAAAVVGIVRRQGADGEVTWALPPAPAEAEPEGTTARH